MNAPPRRAVIGVVALALLAATARAQDSTASRMSRITYLTSVSAYIAAGRDDGLRDGAAVQVIRGGTVIGVLKVAFLASRQAACDIVSQLAPFVVGDSVRFSAALSRDSTAAVRGAPAPTAVQPRSITAPRGDALRGRIGAHYLVVGQPGGGGGFTQPSLDLRLDGRPLGGSDASLGITVDVRARRTASTNGGTTVLDGHARAYQLAMFWNPPGSPTRVTLGRQMAPGAAAVGLFDGLLAEVIRPQWNLGVFGGSQPDPLNLGFATDILEGGGYVQRHNRPGTGALWSATAGVSGSYQNAHANREFAFLQGSVSGPRFSVLVSQEIDYYRPWKRTSGTPAISPTSTFATMRYAVSDRLSLNAGIDNRRNVLLYRDFVDPVTTFDDAFRQGVWAGALVRLSPRVSVGLDARQSSGGAAGRANSYTWSGSVTRVTPLDMTVRARSTYFQSTNVDGWLHSVALAIDPGNRVHLELSGGLRQERDAFAVASQSTRWAGLDLDASLARSWYFMLSASGEAGGDQPTSQIYSGLSVRF